MTTEMLDKLIDLTIANFPMSQNIDVFNVAALWTKHFGDKPDDVMETAFNMVLMDAKYWPTVKDISNAITELTAVNYGSVTFRQLDEPLKERSLASKKAFDIVKSGKSKEYLANMDIGGIKEYVKDKFPDMSDSLIRQNYSELSFAAESAELCTVCMWNAAGCETNGYYPIPHLKKEGYIRLEYAPCVKRKGARNR